MKIVVVDDEPDICFVLRFELELLGHTVATVGSVTEALELIEKDSPDAILCDFQMPKMTGLDFFLTLKAQGKNIPFYILTGEPTMDTKDFLDKGITEVLFKPQDLLQLRRFFK